MSGDMETKKQISFVKLGYQFLGGIMSVKVVSALKTFVGCKVPFIGEVVAVPTSFIGSNFGCLGSFSYLLLSSPTRGLPTLAAYAVWMSVAQGYKWLDRLLHLLLPPVCMAAFCTSPYVGEGWIYSLYWLIPPLCFMVRLLVGRAHLWLTAVSTSFIAHAVGSVMWVYLFPTFPAYWLSLIPLVAHERLFIAALCYSVARFYLLFSSKERAALIEKNEEETRDLQYPL